MDKDSVGLVKTKFLKIDEPFELESGKSLECITIAYETYGKEGKTVSLRKALSLR